MAGNRECISPAAEGLRGGVSVGKDGQGSVPISDKESSTRSDTDIIKDYLGERNLFSEGLTGSTDGAQAGGRQTRQAFSDSSWLDKFLDERDKELDSVLEESDDEEGVTFPSSEGDATCMPSATVPKTHLVGRPSSVAAEDFVRRHQQNMERHLGIDYQDWSSILHQTSGAVVEDRVAGLPLETVSFEGLSVEEILTDDFDSSSGFSSDSEGLPASWAQLGARQLSSLTAETGVGDSLEFNEEKVSGTRVREAVRGSVRQGCCTPNLAGCCKGDQEKGKGGSDTDRTVSECGRPIIDTPDVSQLVSASADRALYAEIVRATERGASQERKRMEALLSVTPTAKQTVSTRLGWSLTFADRQLEDAYRVSHIANGGDADYLCAVLRAWYSLLHLYMLGCQFRILKEVQWGWITISAPGNPVLSTSLEWNIAGLVLMLAFLCLRLRGRAWWNRNRLALLSAYLGSVWSLEVWYTLASHDAPGFRLVRLGSPSFFMSFMYNVPFILHMQARALVMAAQLAALAVRQDFTYFPYVILFHVLSSAVAFFLDRRSRLAFLSKLPPGGILAMRQESLFRGAVATGNADVLKSRVGRNGSSPSQCTNSVRRGDGDVGLGGCGSSVRREGENEVGSTSTSLEEQLRERLRQRRPYGGFAGGFAGVGCVKTGPCCARMVQETQPE